MSAHVLDVSALRPPVRNRDAPLWIYYDESNNPRKLLLADDGFNVPNAQCFVLAGIAAHDQSALPSFAELVTAFRLQPTARELKFKNIADGDFERAIGGRHMATLLDLLLDRGLVIHLSVLDTLYWSLVDVVDSLMAEPRIGPILIHAELKSALRDVGLRDLPALLTLLRSYRYPDLTRESVPAFLSALQHFIDTHRRNGEAPAYALARIMERAASLPALELTFLHDNDLDVLIESFSDFYLHRVYTFSHAHHVFDEETVIEPKLRQLRIVDGIQPIDYRFADSVDEVGIQLSDAVCGTFRTLFDYLQVHELEVLAERRARYTPVQRENIGKLDALIDRSGALSDGLLHYIFPVDLQRKHAAVMGVD